MRGACACAAGPARRPQTTRNGIPRRSMLGCPRAIATRASEISRYPDLFSADSFGPGGKLERLAAPGVETESFVAGQVVEFLSEHPAAGNHNERVFALSQDFEKPLGGNRDDGAAGS